MPRVRRRVVSKELARTLAELLVAVTEGDKNEAELRFGCPFGGWIAYAPGGGQTSLDLQRCAWTEGVPLTGTGRVAGYTTTATSGLIAPCAKFV
mgnify:CR=1 FL=1